MSANILRPLKAGKRHPFYILLIQNIVFCIQHDVCQLLAEFQPKAGKRHPRAKCWQTYPPPNLGGSKMESCCFGIAPLPRGPTAADSNVRIHKMQIMRSCACVCRHVYDIITSSLPNNRNIVKLEDILLLITRGLFMICADYYYYGNLSSILVRSFLLHKQITQH